MSMQADPTTGAAAPTDEEIAELRSKYGVTSSGRGIKEFAQVAAFLREGIARWGAPHASAPAPAQPDPTGRTPQDYAIEHAEYLAQAAEGLLQRLHEASAAEERAHDTEGREEDAATDEWEAALERQGEAMSRLVGRVYEFRKRRDRAKALRPCPGCGKPTGAPDGGHTCSPQAARDEALLLQVLTDACSVISSINHGAQHALTINDETAYWQREEWVNWALLEVLPPLDALRTRLQEKT